MDFKVIVTSKEKKCICLDGFLYRFDQTLKIGDLSWRCTVKNCNARIKTDSGTSNILSQKNDHNHEQCDDRKIERHQLRVYAKRKAADDLTQRPSKIIRAGLKDVGEDSLHPKDLKSVSKAMYRVRRKSQPNLPKSREEVHTLFEGYPVQTSKFENFLQVNDRENGIIIFTCTTNLECLCYVEEIFMDGTFKFCPKFFNQLYTIHGFKNGNYIPLVFILLTGKSEEIYHHCFTKLVELCNDRNLTLKPKTVHVDFEDRVMVVVRNLFPSALLKCCRFHLSQAWWRKIQALGLSKEYKECTTEVGKWLHKFFGLSFLPDADVEDSFVEDMMAEAPKEPRCSKFADYLTENYVTTESRFPPILWAEQPSYSKRTTNGPESFHAHYNAQFYMTHPAIFIFLKTIIEQQSVNYIKIRYIDEQAPQSRIEKEKLDHLFEMWAKFQSGQITRAKFVHSLGFKYQAKTDL